MATPWRFFQSRPDSNSVESEQAVVATDRLGKVYEVGGTSLNAISELNLSVAPGEFVSIVGPSGSGKSTLLRILAGLDVPTKGRVRVAGHELTLLSESQRSSVRLRYIGVVLQAFNLLPTFTLQENVAWPLELQGATWSQALERAVLALEQVGIASKTWTRRPAEVSGGEQQRVAIARALSTESRLLLADEPTGNLDTRTGGAILDLLRQLNSQCNLTVLMVTHSTYAATYGHRTIEFRDGRVIRDVRDNRDQRAQVIPLRCA